MNNPQEESQEPARDTNGSASAAVAPNATKRIRFHFTLMTLLIVTLVCGIFFGRYLAPSMDTRIEALRRWIGTHQEDVYCFFECREENEVLTREEFFYYWIDDYVDEGYEFISVGSDSTGGRFAVWIRPNQEGPPPLVFFGSEGERGVITRSAWDFPLVIAHGPSYPPELDPAENEYLNYEGTDADDLQSAKEARDAFRKYREAVLERYGKLPSFEELRRGREELEAEFEDWLERCQGN